MVKGRFTSAEKSRIVLEFFNTNIGIAELCRKHNLSPQTFYQWKNGLVPSTIGTLADTEFLNNSGGLFLW